MTDSKNSDAEEWRIIPGRPNYEVSSLGNVRTVERTISVSTCDRAIGHTRKLQGHLLSTHICRGYKYAHLANKTKRVSRMVASAFIGPPPSRKHWVNHRNGNKLDDRACNLVWTTPTENLMHAQYALKKRIGENHWKAKLTSSQVWEIKRLIMQGFSDSAISTELAIKPEPIRAIRNGDSWKHIFFDGFVPRFNVKHAVSTITSIASR